MKSSWRSSHYELRKRARVATWWGRFRLSAGMGGVRRDARVAAIPIHNLAQGAEIVDSGEALIAGSVRRQRVWMAHPSQRIDGRDNLLADLCAAAPGGLQEWTFCMEPYWSPPMTFARRRNALVFTRSGAVMLWPWHFIRETRVPWRAMPDPLPGTIGHVDGRPIVRLSATRPARVINGPVLSLCHTHGYNYGHWLADCLPALLDVSDLVANGRLTLLLPPTTAWQRRTLELMGVPLSAVIEVEHPTVAVADLICNSYGGSSHIAYPGPLLAEVFRRLATAANAVDVARPRLVFVSRRQSGYPREFLDEVQLEDSLRRLGFVPLRPEAMTIDEQVSAFSRAEVVVGPHGSALMNAAYSPRGCLVVDIIPEHLRPRAIYEMTRLMGHKLIVLYAPQWPPDGAKAPSGASIPAAAVRFSLEASEIVERVRAGMDRLGIAPG